MTGIKALFFATLIGLGAATHNLAAAEPASDGSCGFPLILQFVAENAIDPPLASRLYALAGIAQHDIFLSLSRQDGVREELIAPAYYRAMEVITQNTLRWAAYPIHDDRCETTSRQLAAGDAAIVAGMADSVTERLLALLADAETAPLDYASQEAVKDWTFIAGKIPLRPTWGATPPLVLDDAERFMAPPAPEFAKLLEETDRVRNAVLATSERERALVLFWADGAGTVTPPGHWAKIAGAQFAGGDAPPERQLFVLAATMIAIHDAVIVCWRTKFRDWVPRPSQVASDIKPQIPVPNFPAYTSGHATISAAAAETLGFYLPEQREKLLSLAREAAQSRVWAGIHYPMDSEMGLEQGERVGRFVTARLVEGRPLAEQVRLR